MIETRDNHSKKVSIIIPVKNEEEHLPLCLESISKLNYPPENIEVIVVDNGSNDSTVNIAEKYGVKVFVDLHLNVSGLRNLGVKSAEGAFLAFVDADCMVHKDWLVAASEYFDNKSVVMWGSPPVIPDNATWVQKTWYHVRMKDDTVCSAGWLESMNMFVRKEQFIEAGGFNESLVTCEDVDLSYRMKRYGQIISDNRVKVVHVGEASTLREFLKKEIWRGQGNLKGIFSHGLVPGELPSLLLPLYFILLYSFVGILMVYQPGIKTLIYGCILYLTPSVYMLRNIIKRKLGVTDIFKLFALLQCYFFARTIAIFVRT